MIRSLYTAATGMTAQQLNLAVLRERFINGINQQSFRPNFSHLDAHLSKVSLRADRPSR